MKKPRKVFGRLRLTIHRKPFTIEMRTDGVWLRQKHQRKKWLVTFEHLALLAHKEPALFQLPDQPQRAKPELV